MFTDWLHKIKLPVNKDTSSSLTSLIKVYFVKYVSEDITNITNIKITLINTTYWLLKYSLSIINMAAIALLCHLQ